MSDQVRSESIRSDEGKFRADQDKARPSQFRSGNVR